MELVSPSQKAHHEPDIHCLKADSLESLHLTSATLETGSVLAVSHHRRHAEESSQPNARNAPVKQGNMAPIVQVEGAGIPRRQPLHRYESNEIQPATPCMELPTAQAPGCNSAAGDLKSAEQARRASPFTSSDPEEASTVNVSCLNSNTGPLLGQHSAAARVHAHGQCNQSSQGARFVPMCAEVEAGDNKGGLRQISRAGSIPEGGVGDIDEAAAAAAAVHVFGLQKWFRRAAWWQLWRRRERSHAVQGLWLGIQPGRSSL